MAEQAEQQEVCRLIRAVQRGEPTAFDDLMACYAPLLKRMIGSFSKTTVLCEAEKEDLKQEAAIALYKAALGFDLGQTKVTFGLVSAIRHRERKKRKEKADSLKEVSVSSEVGSSEGEVGSLLAEAGELLSHKEQTVLQLYSSGLSYKEISKELGCTLKSVDNALSRAKRKLKECRGKQNGGIGKKMPTEGF